MPYFLRFKDGCRMHTGFVPRYRASHGCVRMSEAQGENISSMRPKSERAWK
jgi:lipoprotein-anchoring transpeptidase ErfK/SrfK